MGTNPTTDMEHLLQEVVDVTPKMHQYSFVEHEVPFKVRCAVEPLQAQIEQLSSELSASQKQLKLAQIDQQAANKRADAAEAVSGLVRNTIYASAPAALQIKTEFTLHERTKKELQEAYEQVQQEERRTAMANQALVMEQKQWNSELCQVKMNSAIAELHLKKRNSTAKETIQLQGTMLARVRSQVAQVQLALLQQVSAERTTKDAMTFEVEEMDDKLMEAHEQLLMTGQELNTLIESSAAMLELEQNARAQESTQAANHLASNQANHQAHIEALSQAQARADRRAAEVLAVEQAKTAAEKTKVVKLTIEMQEAELRLNQLTASFQKKIDEQATANYLAEEQRASTQKALDQMTTRAEKTAEEKRLADERLRDLRVEYSAMAIQMEALERQTNEAVDACTEAEKHVLIWQDSGRQLHKDVKVTVAAAEELRLSQLSAIDVCSKDGMQLMKHIDSWGSLTRRITAYLSNNFPEGGNKDPSALRRTHVRSYLRQLPFVSP